MAEFEEEEEVGQRRSSIMPFLPSFSISDSGSLQWPPKMGYVLESVACKTNSSSVSDGHGLYGLISHLREQSGLLPLHTSSLGGITSYFDSFLPRPASQHFFESVLPFIAGLALRLPDMLNAHFKKPMIGLGADREHDVTFSAVHLRVLNAQQAGCVFLSQELVAVLLACAFFCLYPSKGRKDAELPYFNFDGLFSGINNKASGHEHKLHCIRHYYERTCAHMPQGMVSYERKVLCRLEGHEPSSQILDCNETFWSSSTKPLCPMKVLESGTIEDQKSNALEVDFANRFLGGGVLFRGCVQEEIRFVISPELIVGMLFMPAMYDNEAIEIKGAERFSYYTGYGKSFAFAGDYADNRQRDSLGRRETSIIAIDALSRPGEDQFQKSLICREATKAFCGFVNSAGRLAALGRKEETVELQLDAGKCEISDGETQAPQADNMGVATGNWGCGAFGGDVELKSMVQWVAASQAGRLFVNYYTFGGSHGPKLREVTSLISKERWSVGELWNLLLVYGEKRLKREYTRGLFEWILPQVSRRCR